MKVALAERSELEPKGPMALRRMEGVVGVEGGGGEVGDREREGGEEGGGFEGRGCRVRWTTGCVLGRTEGLKSWAESSVYADVLHGKRMWRTCLYIDGILAEV